MQHYTTKWIEDWCNDNGWTDWFIERSMYWGFPPNAVMPMPIPSQALRAIKAEKGFCFEEKVWCSAAIFSAVLGGVFSYFMSSPMPMLAAFTFCAIVTACLEDETLECS